MALKQYGVLVGRVVDPRREDEPSSPHFQIRVKAADVDYRIAVKRLSFALASKITNRFERERNSSLHYLAMFECCLCITSHIESGI